MNLLVIGGGGREHAIVKKLKENPAVETIYCAPGNGGIAADAVCVPEIGAKDISAQVDFAKTHSIDFAVVAPDDPLVLGAVDALEAAGIPCFGPEAKAAIIEGSKVFSKDLMKKYGIPTAEYQVFTDAAAAMDYVKSCALPVVVKADGLALGKGVLIAETREDAVAAVEAALKKRRDFFHALALGELRGDLHAGIVGVALHAQNVVDIRLRDGHGKSGGRVALRFCDICDLLFLRGEQAQLVCLRYRRLRRFRFRRVIGQLYTSSLRMISSACALQVFISPTHFI